ncbi:MAG: YceI family protein [Bacteroidota bacterium]
MKTILFSFLFLTVHFVTTAQRLKLAPSSTVQWRANPIWRKGHEGTIQFSSGWLEVSGESSPVKGEFEVDLATLQNTDIRDAQGRTDLEEHLKSADFFDVAKFKKAMFQITGVKPDGVNRYQVTGFLAIKGIINTITILVDVTKAADKVNVKTKFSIDRTKWGIVYQSKSIFADIKDGAIEDNVELVMNLTFSK